MVSLLTCDYGFTAGNLLRAIKDHYLKLRMDTGQGAELELGIWSFMMFFVPIAIVVHALGTLLVLLAYRKIGKSRPDLAYIWSIANLVSDSVCLNFGMLRFFVYELGVADTLMYSALEHFLTPISSGLLAICNLLLMATSIDRLLGIRWPLWYRSHRTNRRFYAGILPICLVGLGSGIVSFYDLPFMLEVETGPAGRWRPPKMEQLEEYGMIPWKQMKDDIGHFLYSPTTCENYYCNFVEHDWRRSRGKGDRFCLVMNSRQNLIQTMNLNYSTFPIHRYLRHRFWFWLTTEVVYRGPRTIKNVQARGLGLRRGTFIPHRLSQLLIAHSNYLRSPAVGCIGRADAEFAAAGNEKRQQGKKEDLGSNETFLSEREIRYRVKVCMAEEQACHQRHCGTFLEQQERRQKAVSRQRKRYRKRYFGIIHKQLIYPVVTLLILLIIGVCSGFIVHYLRQINRQEREKRLKRAANRRHLNSSHHQQAAKKLSTSSRHTVLSTLSTSSRHNSINEEGYRRRNDSLLLHRSRSKPSKTSHRDQTVFLKAKNSLPTSLFESATMKSDERKREDRSHSLPLQQRNYAIQARNGSFVVPQQQESSQLVSLDPFSTAPGPSHRTRQSSLIPSTMSQQQQSQNSDPLHWRKPSLAPSAAARGSIFHVRRSTAAALDVGVGMTRKARQNLVATWIMLFEVFALSVELAFLAFVVVADIRGFGREHFGTLEKLTNLVLLIQLSSTWIGTVILSREVRAVILTMLRMS